jgi:hypothetical protein
MNIEISEGFLISPNLHDARVNGLVIRNDDDIEVIINTPEGASINLFMRRVYRLVANNFREGNIVLDIEVLASKEITHSDLTVFYSSSDNAAEQGIRSLHSRAVSENKLFVKLNASYGCEFACICERIDIRQDDM